SMAASSATGKPPIHACSISPILPHARADAGVGRSIVIFDISKALIRVRRTFEGPALVTRLPVDDILHLLRQFEVLVGNSLGGVIFQPHLDPGIGRGDIWMVPRSLGKMTNRVDHHERPFPAVGAILAPDPTVFEIPMRQIAL